MSNPKGNQRVLLDLFNEHVVVKDKDYPVESKTKAHQHAKSKADAAAMKKSVPETPSNATMFQVRTENRFVGHQYFKEDERTTSRKSTPHNAKMSLMVMRTGSLDLVAEEYDLSVEALKVNVQNTLLYISRRNNFHGTPAMYKDFMNYKDLWARVLQEHIAFENLTDSGSEENLIVSYFLSVNRQAQEKLINHLQYLLHDRPAMAS